MISDLRVALDQASLQDKKAYYLTITPAGNNTTEDGGLDGTQVDSSNAENFNLINVQSYYDQSWADDFIEDLQNAAYPANQIAVGIDTEGCSATFPRHQGLAGMFNWTISADSQCDNQGTPYEYTKQIATAVGYGPS